MTDSFSYVERMQTRWATAVGKELQRQGYVRELRDNLIPSGISRETLDEFDKADGGELRDSAKRPAKMRCLVSSSALAANFFDGWRFASKEALARALNLTGSISELRFEHKCEHYPVGPGTPNLDLVLRMSDGTRVGIESKFVEQFRSPGVDSAMSLKYFPAGDGHWSRARLPRAQTLVNSMRGRWDYLDAPQLLKHLLGMRAEEPHGRVRLLYIWYDTGLQDANSHRKEVQDFISEVTEIDVAVTSMSYQEVFDAIDEPIEGWKKYLFERYFAMQPVT
jgi:hypothetical protein